MKFHITRTGLWDEDQSPFERAVKEPCIRVDARTFKSEAEHDKRLPGAPWRSQGRNHRKTETGIARDFDAVGWFMELESLDDLLKIAEDAGHSLVVGRSWRNPDMWEVEIYDGYRE